MPFPKFKTIWIFGIFLLSIITLIAQNPAGKPILADGFSSWTVYGTDNPKSIIEEVSVTGQPFAKALRINTFNKPGGSGNCSLNINLISPLQKGDVLWISFRTRSLESKRETGESNIELRVDQLVNGKYVWPPYLERGISFGKEWTETSIPFVIPKDVKVEDVKLVFGFDSYPQRFEIGPVTFLNCGQNVKLEDLPRSVVRYEGGEPDAPWRKAAAERIEKYRKGDLTIKVLDTNGKPVRNAEVSIRMKRNAFNWGTATSSQRLLDPESKIYRDTLLKYFNQVVFENEMKWGPWSQQNPQERGIKTKEALQWLNKKGITTRGHVMVWPSWQHSPKYLTTLKSDTSLLRKEILNHINEQTRIMGGLLDEWDVINEPYAHHDVMDILGKDEMVKWFKAARTGDTGVKLFLNDYTMFHGEGADSPSEKFFDNVKFLKENGAPIDAIGEQAHIGGTPPSIPKVLERLDRFAQLGLPIQISEFDINSNDDEFKARYLRDFLTALYSNPTTIGFVQWGFWEGQHWFPVAAMWNKDWSVRKHGKVYTDLVTKTWWTNADGKTTKDGTYKVRGFCGDYEVAVKL
ncbi:MAG: endo-1,4-beta-xylanase, partial [Mariniphaga sp.]|nr:endo-1,4-beta-xylanase [Mariniphaga sp.]